MKDLFIDRTAVISDCGRYRYLLRRTWDRERMRALFAMLNASTANAEKDDPTIRSCARLCRSWGYGSFEVVNLYGWRETDPKKLAALNGSVDLVGPDNDHIIEAAVNRCDMAVCAWGAHQMASARANTVYHILHRRRPAVFCLGTTKDGHPKHPLYIKTGTVPVVYRSAA